MLRLAKSLVARMLGSAINLQLELDAANLVRARQRSAALESADFVDRNMRDVPCFPNKLDLLQFSTAQVADVDGLLCEFGVFKGHTLNFIASRTKKIVHGFDSFEGLPEFWTYDHGKGALNAGKVPKVRSNVQLHKGLFSATLPEFTRRFPDRVAFLHLDADLYSSTKTVFEYLGKQILPGTVIQFDEYFNYPGWQEHEHRAFQEYVESARLSFKYIGYTPYRQVTVKILALEELPPQNCS